MRYCTHRYYYYLLVPVQRTVIDHSLIGQWLLLLYAVLGARCCKVVPAI